MCGACMASSYRSVDLTTLSFEPVAKQGKLYVANLSPALSVLTPPVELATPLDSDAPFAYVRPAGDFARFLHDVEAFVLDQCLKRKSEWFRKDLDDDALRNNFKSFFREGEFKVKVAGEVAAFGIKKEPIGPEDVRVGQQVRCVLELERVCFGRQEFGAMWRLVQVREVEVPACMIDDAAEDSDSGVSEDGRDDDERDADEQEFL